MGVKVRVAIGETVTVVLPWSEVCMSMRVAGRPHRVTLLSESAAQLATMDGERVSFPVLPGEAGLYRDAVGWYAARDALDGTF